jgi:hypothetical protein
MSISHKLKSAAVATAIVGSAFGAMAVTAGTASADINVCKGGYVCLFDNDNFNGDSYRTVAGGSFNVPGFFNDRTTSVFNNSGINYCFFKDANFSGLSFGLNAGVRTSNVGTVFNDSITSFKPC